MYKKYQLIRTPQFSYIYDTSTNNIVRISDENYDVILNEKDQCIESRLSELFEYNIISNDTVTKIEHPQVEYLEELQKKSLTKLTLQVTQRCNLRCDYCAYSGMYSNRLHGHLDMQKSVAKKSLDFFQARSEYSNEVSISFYGGEPLLNFELIKYVVNEAKIRFIDKSIVYNMTTNGSLLTPEISKFLVDNKFSLVFSIDGDADIHNKNRQSITGGETFDKVYKNLKYLKDTYPEYAIKYIGINTVIDKQHSPIKIMNFFDNDSVVNDLYHKYTFVSRMYLDTPIIASDEYFRNAKLLSTNQYYNRLGGSIDEASFIDPYLGGLYKSYHQRERNMKLSTSFHHNGPCLSGVKSLFVNINGDFYPCEKVSEETQTLKIGNIDEGFDIEKSKNITNIGELTKDQCVSCWAMRLCSICQVFCDTKEGLSRKQKMQWCGYEKIRIKREIRDYLMLTELGIDFDGIFDLLKWEDDCEKNYFSDI